jgi:uncharacterized DUF497 family protein
MRLADDPDTAAWLEQLGGTPGDFDWDAGNRTKNRKHGVESVDIESMFHARTVFVGRIVQPTYDEPRWLLLGQDPVGRQPALVFTRRGARLRPVSCRPMRANERRLYEEARHQDGQTKS